MLFFLVKAILLLSNQTVAFNNFRRKTKLVEMILPTLFIVIGIILIVKKQSVLEDSYFIAKLVLVVVFTVLGIIGLRKSNKALTMIALLIGFYIFGISWTKSLTLSKSKVSAVVPSSNKLSPVEAGQQIYVQLNCKSCHGENGNAQMAGAVNLQTSRKSDEYIKTVIMNGKIPMPAFKDQINANQLDDLVQYVKSLRK